MQAVYVLGLRSGSTSASGVPKTPQSTVLLRIDQLPAGPVLVLRIASVLDGFSFDTGILRKVLEPHRGQTSGLSDEHLATLREFQFASPVDHTAQRQTSLSDSPNKGETWKVGFSAHFFVLVWPPAGQSWRLIQMMCGCFP